MRRGEMFLLVAVKTCHRDAETQQKVIRRRPTQMQKEIGRE